MKPAAPPLPSGIRFVERLHAGGVEPGDSPELQLNKQLLMFATGLASVASMAWLTIYWMIGPQFSVTYPYLFQLALAANALLYILTRNFNFFRISQLALFLLAPFVIQWSIGNFISASGIVLWGLLAPVGAILFFGVRESAAWFIAWVFLTILSGYFDFMTADSAARSPIVVPVSTSIVFFVLNFVAVATMIYVLLRFSIEEKRRIQARLEEAHRLLQTEQDRSEHLLLNILPAPVARRLKNQEQTIADRIPDATVMFADIVNFTEVAAHMAPGRVFDMLNQVFSAFDDLVDRHGLEKIKTIGDAYMVAGGINSPNADYTTAMAELALAMNDILGRDFRVNTANLEIRIGIGTGPLVAGIVGKHKFIYDLWGDTVNLASRLTSEAKPGMIYCDAVTHHRLVDGFAFHPVQKLALKGKGEVSVYRLSSRLSAGDRPAPS